MSRIHLALWLGLGPWAIASCTPAAPEPATPNPAASTEAVERALSVRVTGLRSKQGSLLISVHDKEEGFPGDAESAVRSDRLRLRDADFEGGVPTIYLSKIYSAVVGVAVVHDENDNQSLDTNFIGIPTEGLGASNDAQGTFGPPDFDDAKIRLVQPHSQIAVDMVYFL